MRDPRRSTRTSARRTPCATCRSTVLVARGDRDHRTVGVRQVDAAPLPQPDARDGADARASRARCCFDGQDIYADGVDPIALRRHVGMVFQRPTPFPTMSIRDNVAAGLRVQPRRAARSRASWTTIVERALAAGGAVGRGEGPAHVERHRHSPADSSSASASRARSRRRRDVLLLDEPTASLDPLSTQKVEELVYELRQSMTVIIVTHNMQQAARVSDRTVFMLAGRDGRDRADARDVHHARRSRAPKRTSPGRFG